MYPTTNTYKSKIYNDSTRHILRVFLDGFLVDEKYIGGFKPAFNLFPQKKFALGTVVSQSAELILHESIVPQNISQIYVESGISQEIIPYGYYNIDANKKINNHKVTLKLYDNMIKFEFLYDGSQVIQQNGYAEIIDVLEDICDQAEVELGSTSFLNMHTRIAVYDASISARTYLSYIAEQAGGFACIGRDGKLYIRQIGQDIAEVPINYFQDFTWGEKFKVSRVRYEDGIQLFEKGDTTDRTVYINQENMYIVSQEQIDNIYDEINELEVYSFKGNSIIDPAIDVGDLLLIDNKYVIYQGNCNCGKKIKASISSEIEGEFRQETTTRVPSQKMINRRVESSINQQDGNIKQLIKDVYEENGTINEKFVEVYQNIDGVVNNVQNSGGNNLIKNSVMFAYDNNGVPNDWDLSGAGTLTINSSPESLNAGGISGHVFTLNNKTVKQRIYVKADNDNIPEEKKIYYTFSTKIRKNSTGTAYVKIYNDNEEYYVVNFASGEDAYYKEFEKTALLPTMNYYDIEFYGSDESDATFTDSMFSVGKYKTQWQQANGEIMNTQVNISVDGVIVKSVQYEGNYTVMSPLEFAGYAKVNGIITKVFTVNGDTTEVEKLKAKSRHNNATD